MARVGWSRWAIVALCASPGVGACSFPDLQFIGDLPEGGPDGSFSDDATLGDSAAAGDATGNPDVADDGPASLPEAAQDDGPGASDADGGSAVDGDAGGGDARDASPDALTDAPTDAPDIVYLPDGGCVCPRGYVYPTNQACGLLGVGLLCNGANGFSDDPGCGQSGTYILCTNGAVCSFTTETRMQQCK